MSGTGLLVEPRGAICLIRIDRPESRNSLSTELLVDLGRTLSELSADRSVRAVVLAGNEKVFASGANIRNLADATATQLYFGERFRAWDAIRRAEVPLVAAVSGYCLGGGLELALLCDVIVSSDDARFGLPETGLGLIPGAGGTQRLVRTIGKSKAMEMVLSGRLLSAAEADAAGLVSRVVREGRWLDEAVAVAEVIAERSPVAVRLAKEAVAASFETTLEAGLDVERKAFAIAFASADAREGISAFLEKRKPCWPDPI